MGKMDNIEVETFESNKLKKLEQLDKELLESSRSEAIDRIHKYFAKSEELVVSALEKCVSTRELSEILLSIDEGFKIE